MAGRTQKTRWWSAHRDALTQAILVFPLFAIYQLGVILGARGNAADFVSGLLIDLSRHDPVLYLQLVLGMVVVYGLTIWGLRRSGTFHPSDFVPVLLESGGYALVMGSIILFVMRHVLGGVPGLALGAVGPVEVIVVSAGAGFHEELLFRMVLLGGTAKLLSGFTSRRAAWLWAMAISSLLFSLVHHVGVYGDPFDRGIFVYRALAGVYFGLIYVFRGFAMAAWTHALYDVYVLWLRPQ